MIKDKEWEKNTRKHKTIY